MKLAMTLSSILSTRTTANTASQDMSFSLKGHAQSTMKVTGLFIIFTAMEDERKPH